MNKYFKNLSKAKKEAAPVPRKIEEIKADNDKLASSAGIIQHQIYSLQKSLKRVNEAMLNLDYEAEARYKLDKEENNKKADQEATK